VRVGRYWECASEWSVRLKLLIQLLAVKIAFIRANLFPSNMDNGGSLDQMLRFSAVSQSASQNELRYRWSMLQSQLMQGRKDDQKNGNETGNTVSGELDEQALTRDITRFVEETDLSIPKIASEMGVLSATLTMWIAGTTKPSRRELLAIKSFLERRK
jgi:DNA-binding transcriptional regulator YiaG